VSAAYASVGRAIVFRGLPSSAQCADDKQRSSAPRGHRTTLACQADDFFLDGILHQLRLIVNVELAHQVEFVRFNGLDTEIQRARYLFNGIAFRQEFENFQLPRVRY